MSCGSSGPPDWSQFDINIDRATPNDNGARLILKVNGTGPANEPNPMDNAVVHSYEFYFYNPNGNSGALAGGDLSLVGTMVSAVPEPTSWLMMILGLGIIGGAMRARRRDLVLDAITPAIIAKRNKAEAEKSSQPAKFAISFRSLGIGIRTKPIQSLITNDGIPHQNITHAIPKRATTVVHFP